MSFCALLCCFMMISGVKDLNSSNQVFLYMYTFIYFTFKYICFVKSTGFTL
jgi:hypothetical protein